MSDNIFNKGRTVESFAYDLALTLASKDKESSNPLELAKAVKRLLPECLEASRQIYEDEMPKPFKVDIGFNR